MTLRKAIDVQKIISKNFLFSRQRQFATSLDWDDGPTLTERIIELFDRIFGVGITNKLEDGYVVQLLSESNLDLNPIYEYFKLGENDIVLLEATPFELRMRKRPLEIGCSVSHKLNNLRGTLGCFVKGIDDGYTYVLSNRHVLFNANDSADDFIVQPSSYDGGTSEDAIGLYHKSLPYSESEINEYDAAIAGPVSADTKMEVPHFNKKINGILEPFSGLKVYKIGANSGITFGRVESFSTNIKVIIDNILYDFANQILIKGCDKSFINQLPFSFPGDSGSLIIDYEKNAAVGLLFAGNKEGLTLANPIGPLLSKLEVEFHQ